MWPNPQFPVDLVTFTELLNRRLKFLFSEKTFNAIRTGNES